MLDFYIDFAYYYDTKVNLSGDDMNETLHKAIQENGGMIQL